MPLFPVLIYIHVPEKKKKKENKLHNNKEADKQNHSMQIWKQTMDSMPITIHTSVC